MSRLKFDAALQLHLQYGSPSAVAVSVRLSAPLAPDELAQAVQLGLHGADLRRRVLTGTLSPAALAWLAKLDKVVQLSLARTVAPLSASAP